MANAYNADEHEIRTLREVFGPATMSVTFYDADEMEALDGYRWSLAVGFNDEGDAVRELTPFDQAWQESKLTELADERGETVKFALDLP